MSCEMNYSQELRDEGEGGQFKELLDDILLSRGNLSEPAYCGDDLGNFIDWNSSVYYQIPPITRGNQLFGHDEYDNICDGTSGDNTVTAPEPVAEPNSLDAAPLFISHAPTSIAISVPQSDCTSLVESSNHNEGGNHSSYQYHNDPDSLPVSQTENGLMLVGAPHTQSSSSLGFNVEGYSRTNIVSNPVLINCFCPQPGCQLNIDVIPLSEAELINHTANYHYNYEYNTQSHIDENSQPFGCGFPALTFCLQPNCEINTDNTVKRYHLSSTTQVVNPNEENDAILDFGARHSKPIFCPQLGYQSNIFSTYLAEPELEEYPVDHHFPPSADELQFNGQSTAPFLWSESPTTIVSALVGDDTATSNDSAVQSSDPNLTESVHEDSVSTKKDSDLKHPIPTPNIADPTAIEGSSASPDDKSVAPYDNQAEEDPTSIGEGDSSNEEDLDPMLPLAIPEPDSEGRIRCTERGCTNKIGFKSEGTYRTHVRKHHNGPDERPKKKDRTSKASLVPEDAMVKTSEGGKVVFTCAIEDCSHRSTSKNSFIRHYISKHIESIRDSCPLCNWRPDQKIKTFGRADGVQKHISRYHAQIYKNDPVLTKTLRKLRRGNGDRNVWDKANEPAGKGFEGRDENGLFPNDGFRSKKRRRMSGKSKPKHKMPETVPTSLDPMSDTSIVDESHSHNRLVAGPAEAEHDAARQTPARKKLKPTQPSLKMRKRERDTTNLDDLQPNKKVKTSHTNALDENNLPAETVANQVSLDTTDSFISSNVANRSIGTSGKDIKMIARTNYHSKITASRTHESDAGYYANPLASYNHYDDSSLRQVSKPQHRAGTTESTENLFLDQYNTPDTGYINKIFYDSTSDHMNLAFADHERGSFSLPFELHKLLDTQHPAAAVSRSIPYHQYHHQDIDHRHSSAFTTTIDSERQGYEHYSRPDSPSRRATPDHLANCTTTNTQYMPGYINNIHCRKQNHRLSSSKSLSKVEQSP